MENTNLAEFGVIGTIFKLEQDYMIIKNINGNYTHIKIDDKLYNEFKDFSNDERIYIKGNVVKNNSGISLKCEDWYCV